MQSASSSRCFRADVKVETATGSPAARSAVEGLRSLLRREPEAAAEGSTREATAARGRFLRQGAGEDVAEEDPLLEQLLNSGRSQLQP